MIKVTNLSRSFGSIQAVDNISFEVETGEAIGLLGPNGAGKSTTINMIIGALSPDAGSIQIDDKSDPTDRDVRRLLGVVPQSLSLYDGLSAVENLRFFGKLYGLGGTKLNEAVKRSLQFAQLENRAKDRVSTFSGGMKRRLNMAAAILHEPKVILFDEPTVGVDPQSRNHIFDSIEQLQQQDVTIVYTTHYMEEAQRLCDRIAIIDHGKLLDLGSVDALIETHAGDSVVEAELEKGYEINVDLPGQLAGNQLSFESANPLQEIAELTSAGVRFASLKVSKPDLESVFLHLTGRSLRD